MTKKLLYLIVAAAALSGCSSAIEIEDSTSNSSMNHSEQSNSSSSQSGSSEIEESSVAIEEESSQMALIWSSREEAIDFYEQALIEELGEEMASLELNMEFYDRDSWKVIENTGDTILLSNTNGGIGGENIVEFIKEKKYTVITTFAANSPYPDRPTSKWTVRNSDMVTTDTEDLNPIDPSLVSTESTESTKTIEESNDRPLSEYSVEEVEYARVWLEVIGKIDIEELNISYLPAGEPVNSYEENNSATYPEEVTVLSGKIMADGIVVYSGNGDGTIQLYEVPSHWQEGVLPEGKTMKEYTTDIISHPLFISIGTGKDEDVIKLIKRENIQK